MGFLGLESSGVVSYTLIMHIVFYASAHGMGHLVRLAEVGRAVLARDTACRLTFRGRVLTETLRARVGRDIESHSHEVDIGVVEIDHSTQDLAATARAGEVLLDHWEKLRTGETQFLREQSASAVVSDLPGVPLEAASDVGIPGIAMGNFSWDWVYGQYDQMLGDPVFGRLADRFRRAYETATCLARIPIGSPMTAFPKIFDVGLVGRRGDDKQADRIRKKHDLQSPCVLLAIGKPMDMEGLRQSMAQCRDYHFFGFDDLGDGGLPYTRLDDDDREYFPELLVIADVIVTTLGHSILSEAVTNGVPIVTFPRLEYPEYDLLLSQGSRCHPIVELGLEEFRAHECSDALDRVLAFRSQEDPPPTTGADDIADLVLETAKGKI